MTASPAGRPRVAVVGGGWAGCAAAVALADEGVHVTLLEQSRSLGGRARRVALDGLALDNGQHLLIGAYRRTLALVRRVHPAGRAEALFRRLRLALRPLGGPAGSAISLSAPRLPAPLNVAVAVLAARGLDLRERAALIDGFRRLARHRFRVPAAQTVAQCFAGTPLRAMAAVWEPLCIAALNTPPEAASAQVFANVLRMALAGSRRDSDFLVPAVDLTALFPDPAADMVARHGGSVRVGAAVRGVARRDGRVVLDAGGAEEVFDAAVIAVAPHQLAAALGPEGSVDEAWRAPLAQVRALGWESITTVYLAYAEPVPLPAPLVRLDDAPAQWLFDRREALGASAPHGARALVAAVISTSGPHDGQPQDALAATVDAQLRRMAGRWPLPVWSRVIAERRATYACTPDAVRPHAGRVAAGLYLAGDYTDPVLPPTLEAATRSGVAAARELLADHAVRPRGRSP